MQRAAKKTYWSYQDLLQWDSPHLHKRKWRHPQHRNNPQPLATRTKSYKAMARREAHHRRTKTMIKKTLTEARSSRFSPSLPSPSIDEALDDDMPSLILFLDPPLLDGHSRNKCGLEFPENSPQFCRLLLIAKTKHVEPPGMKPKELQCRKQWAESKGNAIAMAITTWCHCVRRDGRVYPKT